MRYKLLGAVIAISLIIAAYVALTGGPPSEAVIIKGVKKCVFGMGYEFNVISKIEIYKRFDPIEQTIIRDGTTRSKEKTYLVQVNVYYKDGNSELRSIDLFRKGIYWYGSNGNVYVNISK